MFDRLKTIHGKQVLLAVVVSAVPLLLLGHLFNMFASEVIREDVVADLRQITSDKAQGIRQWFAERSADVVLLASTNYVRDLFSPIGNADRFQAFRDFYEEFARQYGVYSRVYVFDREGRKIETWPEADDPPAEVPRRVSEAIGVTHISDAFLYQGSAHVFISTRIPGPAGTQGYLTTVVDLSDLNEITDNIRVGRTGEAYLVNSSGYFVTHQQRRRVLTEDVSDVGIISRLISGREMTFVGEVIDYRNIPVLGAYFYLPELGWGLVAEQDVQEAFAPVRRLSGTLLVWLLTSTVVVALFALLLTSWVLRPLNLLKHTIKQIRSGDMTVRFPVRQRDEIGRTGEVFNDMLTQLQDMQGRLQQKVEAADEQLLRAHSELQKQHEELKQAQQRLLQSERLSTMGEVAAGLAHEINNPLSTMNMLISSLREDEDLHPEERDRALTIISEEIEKIASMIGRFQDLTQEDDLRREPLIIEKIIDRTISLLRPKLEQTGVRVNTHVAAGLPVVLGDDRHVRQLLLNLVLNSINAMPDGGELSIEVRPHREEGQGYLRLSVRDTGSGIPADVRDRIFNPFFTTRAEGTGLGLLIVQRTAERHGGRVQVESEEGAGTTMIVDLPQEGPTA